MKNQSGLFDQSKLRYGLSQSESGFLGLSRSIPIRNWTLELTDDLPLHRIVAQGIGDVGYLVGYAYDPRSGELIEGDLVLSEGESRSWVIDQSVEWSGVFLLIILHQNDIEVRLDPGGQLPLFFRSEVPRLAGSISELASPSEIDARLNKALHADYVASRGNGGWIPGTLTAVDGIRRLLPNHGLLLSSLEATRFWPTELKLHHDMNIEHVAKSIAIELRSFIHALAANKIVSSGLTAGEDSRSILCASRDVLSNVQFFTVDFPQSRLDNYAATELAKRWALKHKTIDFIASTPEEEREWDRLVGYSVVEAGRSSVNCLAQLEQGAWIMDGAFGEIGRCFYYGGKEETINEKTLTVAALMASMGIPDNAAVRADLDHWLSSTDHLCTSVRLDLAYLELRVASWAMGQKPGGRGVARQISPFAQRRIFEMFMASPPSAKKGSQLFRKIYQGLWPEVAMFPVNQYGDYRDILRLAKKISDIPRVIRFVRKKLALAR